MISIDWSADRGVNRPAPGADLPAALLYLGVSEKKRYRL